MRILKSLLRNPASLIGLVILGLVILFAIFAPLIFPQSPWAIVGPPVLAPFVDESFPLGTDQLGRDVASGIVHGAYISLLIGMISTVVSLAIGVPLGALAGYYGGWIDDVLMRVTEFFQVIPTFAFAIVLVAIFQPSVTSIVVAIALVSWPPVARLLRAEIMSLRKREFVEAAILSGQRPLRIIIRQVLPNALSPVIVLASMMVATAILTESGLSFMGLGDPDVMSWGYMVGAGRTLIRSAWWISFLPGCAIMLTVLAFNLIGNGLNDALNPRLQKRAEA